MEISDGSWSKIQTSQFPTHNDKVSVLEAGPDSFILNPLKCKHLKNNFFRSQKSSRGKTFFSVFFPKKAPSWRNASVRWDVCTPTTPSASFACWAAARAGRAAATPPPAPLGRIRRPFRRTVWCLWSHWNVSFVFTPMHPASRCTQFSKGVGKRESKFGYSYIWRFFSWRSCNFALIYSCC